MFKLELAQLYIIAYTVVAFIFFVLIGKDTPIDNGKDMLFQLGLMAHTGYKIIVYTGFPFFLWALAYYAK